MTKVEEYEDIAVRLLSRFGKYIYRNPDYINIVVEYLHTSDDKFDPKLGVFETYRYGALQKAVRKILRDNKKSLIRNSNRVQITSQTVCEKTETPLSELIEREQVSKRKDALLKCLSGPMLTRKEKLYIEQHYLDEKSISDLMLEHDVTKQAISYTILSGLKKLRSVYGGKEICN